MQGCKLYSYKLKLASASGSCGLSGTEPRCANEHQTALPAHPGEMTLPVCDRLSKQVEFAAGQCHPCCTLRVPVLPKQLRKLFIFLLAKQVHGTEFNSGEPKFILQETSKHKFNKHMHLC